MKIAKFPLTTSYEIIASNDDGVSPKPSTFYHKIFDNPLSFLSSNLHQKSH
jgi:hypothetical protein